MADVSVSTEKHGMRFNLQVNRDQTGFQMTLLAKNLDSKVKSMTFRSSQMVDFAVEKDGQRIWVWSAGRMFSQALMDKHLVEGEVLGPYTAHWTGLHKGSNEVGDYRIKAYFLALSRTEPVVEASFNL